MEPMNKPIALHLSIVRDLYRTIREVTARAVENFSIEALDAAIVQRSLLLSRIEDEREEIERVHGQKSWKGQVEYGEIRGHIEVIAALDREAAARVRCRMNGVRQELVSLAETSRAARSYTRSSAL